MLDQLLRDIASTPNAPFLYGPSRKMIERMFSDHPDVAIQKDEFALYVRVKHGHSSRRVIVVTHLDHPGIVLKNSRHGIPFGSVGYERIVEHLTRAPIPVRVYDLNGAYQQLAYLTDFKMWRGSPMVSLQAKNFISPNSHAIWDVPTFEKNNGIIKMHNADNGAVTAVAMELLNTSTHMENIDLEVLFVYVEEVHQISSTGIALRGKTPFGAIDDHTFIINLEAMEIESNTLEKSLIDKFGLSFPNYDAGVLIKVNDGQLIYGFHFPNLINEAELVVKTAATELNIAHQYTITTGSTDAKSFSLFPLTPHIVTLAVPCKWKHNQGSKGEFVPEEVYERDLENTLALLKAVIQPIQQTQDKLKLSLNAKLKENGYGLSVKQVKKLRNQRVSIMKAAQPRLRKGVYFDTSLREFIEFNFWRVASKFIN